MKSFLMTRHARFILLTTLTFSLHAAPKVSLSSISTDMIQQLFEISSSIKGDASIQQIVEKYKRASSTQKKDALINLSYEVKKVLFEHLANMLLDSSLDMPFKVPTHAPDLSQMDVFLYLALQLMENDSRYTVIRPALEECIGETSLWRISGRLARPNFRHLIPASLAQKIFGLNLRVLAALKPTMEKRLQRPTVPTHTQHHHYKDHSSSTQQKSFVASVYTLLTAMKAWLIATKAALFDTQKILLEKIRALYQRGIIKL